MFWRKRKKDGITGQLWNIPVLNEPQSKEVSCKVCKHRILRSDATEIKGEDGYYCPEHKPPYDEVVLGCDSLAIDIYIEPHIHTKTKYYRHIPATKVEVDKNGKEIKKK